MKAKINLFNQGRINYEKFFEIFQGWNAYAKWADSYNLKRDFLREIFGNI